MLLNVFQMLHVRSLISLSLIPREGNEAADCLAALASKEVGPHGLILESPPSLATVILWEATEGHLQALHPVLGEDREGIG